MIITCTNCSMRLQVEDDKVPARPFSLRCPKCQSIVHAQPPPVTSQEETAFTVGQSPASGHPRMETVPPAQPYKMDSSVDRDVAQPEKSSDDGKDLVRMLVSLLQRGTQGADKLEARNLLVCVGDVHREPVAEALAESEYQVHVAPNKAKALERMRDERIDIIILSSDFDPAEQGTAFITREVSTMRPAERRRVFLVQLTEAGRSMDAHAAFINNVNLIVNPADMEKLPRTIERAMRGYNDLYRSFNDACGVRAI